jgi:BirA family biotin operon repressor/biotin-[acetyl-CoA-carboxylase] ligase
LTWFTASHVPPEPHLPTGWRLMAFDELDSTNAALKRIVEQGGEVDEGLVVWAHSQTGGRGRSGRIWVSPPGNVYASILVRAPETPRHAPEIGFVTALAVRDTILDLPRHNAAPPVVACKWPNDVLVDGKKVSGILTEMATDPDGRTWIIAGVGINLIPVEVSDVLYPIGALSDYRIDTTPAHVLTVLGRMVTARLGVWRSEGFGPIRDAWLECGPTPGTPLTVRLPEGTATGAFSGLDENGALLLDTEHGRRRLLVGDVMFQGED